ncbi:unnamed protein product [Rotaria sordida]|uniref:Uncharacterized protein n=1 Tax=Rotaria sordida TaxID=392033 RepID=A0A819BYS3_9BILA|nr:unnamed protein product [Rotaria sordida]CAF3808941.1 unnamed protein product [Rotaria sordida]
MAEIDTLQISENLNNNYDHCASSPSINSSRNLLIPERNSNEQIPQMYCLRLNDDKQTTSYDQRKLSSLKIDGNFHLSPIQPELYHLKVGENNTENKNYRSSLVMISEKRKSSIPYQSLNEQKPEVYYISKGDEKTSEYNKQLPFPNNIRQQNNLNDTIIHPNSSSKEKVITYMIATSEEDEFQSSIQHTSSSPIHPSKKKQIVSFDINDDNDKYSLSNKQNDFPIETHDISTNICYIPLS